MIKVRFQVFVVLVVCLTSFVLFQQNSSARIVAKGQTTQAGPEPVKKAVSPKIAPGEEQIDEKEKKAIKTPEEPRASKKAAVKPSSTIVTETFEGLFPQDNAWQLGWWINGYTWDDDDYRPHNGAWSGWCADGSYLGYPDLDPAYDNYPNYTNAWMVYGPFDLSDATSAELLFYYWNESEAGYDYFQWLASSNGNNFYGYQVSGYSGGWVYQNFDLTSVPTIGNLCGDSSVWIAFRFVSDRYITYRGAFIDDIVLRKEVILLDVTVYPNETAPGGNCYLWKKYDFTLDQPGDLYIQLIGEAENGAQNGTGDDDDLGIQLDSTFYGWNNVNSLDGNAQNGSIRTVNLTASSVSAGSHTLKLWVDETPTLYALKLSQVTIPQQVEVYPNETAPGGNIYRFKTFDFTLDSQTDLYIQLAGLAHNGAQNGTGDDDDLSIQLDDTFYGWNNANSLDGNAQNGSVRIVSIKANSVSAGSHTLTLWADETPVLYSLEVTID